MDGKHEATFSGKGDELRRLYPEAFAESKAPTAAPGAKDGATEGHRLLASGDCSCGWKAGSLLSHDQAMTAWADHREIAARVRALVERPAKTAEELAGRIVDATWPARDVAPGEICPGCGEPLTLHKWEPIRTREYWKDGKPGHLTCPSAAVSLPPVEVGPLPHLADSLSQVTSEGEARTREVMCADAEVCAAIRRGVKLHVDEAIRLRELINTPEIIDFVKAVQIEAVHQRERWGTEQDEGKTAADWFWLLGYLAGKALNSDKVGDQKKLLHHIITTAAACANWHAQVLGKCDMRPGIATPEGEAS